MKVTASVTATLADPSHPTAIVTVDGVGSASLGWTDGGAAQAKIKATPPGNGDGSSGIRIRDLFFSADEGEEWKEEKSAKAPPVDQVKGVRLLVSIAESWQASPPRSADLLLRALSRVQREAVTG